MEKSIAINFIFSKEINEERLTHSKNDNIKHIKLLKNFLNHFYVDIKLGWKHQ